ncbi:MAG: DUF4159 domain-containing protein [Ignavibacteriaceae bacterium]
MSIKAFKIPGYELSEYLQKKIVAYRKQLLLFLGISLLIHLIPIIANFDLSLESVEKKKPPTTVKFIQRAPKLQKQLELQKTPKIVQRNMQRTISPQKMSMMPRTMTTSMSHGGTALGSLGRPGDIVDRSFSPRQQFYGPNISTEIANTRAGSKSAGSLKDELIDYTNYADRFYGLVQQGKNKKDVYGNLDFYQLQYRGSKPDENGEPGWNVVPQALPALVEYAEDNTKLNIHLRGSIRLDSKELLKIPMLYMMGSESSPIYSDEEVKGLENYLRNGGFIFIDDGYAAEYGAYNQKCRQMLKDALGFDAEFERIPNNHLLYHCWEDFAGPPPGEDEVRPNPDHPVKERYRYLEGIFLNGRLAVLFSNKGFCKAWGNWPRNPANSGGPLDNTRQLQFGLNVIVFACTQKGGIIDQNLKTLANEQK